MKNKNYNNAKNYIHNELGISKEFIRNMIYECIYEQIDLIAKNTFKEFDTNQIVNNSIDNCLKNTFSEKYFVDKINERICEKFNI